jgi:poly-D-alanine transfer protein DltD
MKNDRLGRIRSADIEELNFEPLLVEHFISIVKNFQGIADNVEVVMLPKNSKWIHYTPAAKERLAKVVKQIEQATGTTVKNHQDLPVITSDMYRDTTHLARYRGDVVYTKFLVKKFWELL